MSCKESQWNTKWVVTGLFFQVCTKHNPAHQQHHRASVQPLPCYNHWLDSLNIFLFNLISFSAHNKHGELGRENKWEFVWCNRQAEAIGERSGSDYLYKRWVVSCEWMSHENFKHFSTLYLPADTVHAWCLHIPEAASTPRQRTHHPSEKFTFHRFKWCGTFQRFQNIFNTSSFDDPPTTAAVQHSTGFSWSALFTLKK